MQFMRAHTGSNLGTLNWTTMAFYGGYNDYSRDRNYGYVAREGIEAQIMEELRALKAKNNQLAHQLTCLKTGIKLLLAS